MQSRDEEERDREERRAERGNVERRNGGGDGTRVSTEKVRVMHKGTCAGARFSWAGVERAGKEERSVCVGKRAMLHV